MMLKSVVCYFAHPDDETVLAGGIINLLVKQGVHVHLVCATRGEGGELGEPPVVARQELLGAVRERELRCAANALGASVTVLDYVDPVVGPDEVLYPFDADFDTLAKQFGDIARRRAADVILTHGADGEYGHPAHQLVHRAALHGVRAQSPKTLIYTVAALVPTIEDKLWNTNEPAHLALDIRPWAEAKIAAMECHVSQHALFKRRKRLKTVREALRTTESVRRQWPETHGEQPDDAFATLLRDAGAWSP
ncbi:MAG: PIG-L family deacetylase [Chloroflexi bacterium]|nr:MAG: PIG-L family deacetylase [Chloroflexota bacterium]